MEYAAEARRVVDEGGVMVHLHARTPSGAPSHEISDFRAITSAIRDGKVSRMQLFTEREAAVEAAGLTATKEETR